MPVVASLRDGRVMAKCSVTTGWATKETCTYYSCTVADLRQVEEILQLNLKASDCSPFNIVGQWHSGNVVGLSVYAVTGTSISGDIITVGF